MATKSVLLVDDDVDFLEVNGKALAAAGFEVKMAHDGDEGFRMATEAPPDVAVLDVMMRTADEGFTLARKLRRDDRSRTVPLLMLTSVNEVNRLRGHPFHFSDEDRDPMWLPVDRFRDKPVTAGELVSLVRELAG